MAFGVKKTEHNGAKKGRGAYWGKKRFAKFESNRRRRLDGKSMLVSDKGDCMQSSTIDKYSYHEALDRTWILLNNLESSLGEHPVIKGNPQTTELYEKAVENLAQLYQKLGEISVES
ncbi:hypothetical protein [Aliiglaciecola lipolytica]|uniref:Uncharacterized protein n=1 Tax=Aliiglaciecola lipolytica E3 TaxID=1127673 RepID=K6YQS8_9ALTE|nr:hypothetical protein [Aliiglaciecola lipolytica]GAC13680.1 hypothetical protein GLIP_1038 [Aliiglaciecola lipolytica E3]